MRTFNSMIFNFWKPLTYNLSIHSEQHNTNHTVRLNENFLQNKVRIRTVKTLGLKEWFFPAICHLLSLGDIKKAY